MPDDPTMAAEEAVEETPVTETPDASTEADETSTEDLGALKRAYERQKEEARAAKDQLRRIREDEDARREFLTELGYEIAEPDNEDEDLDEDDEPVNDPRVDKHDAWIQQQEAKERAARFTTDLTEAAGDRSVSKFAKDWISLETARTGDNQAALKKAVETWFANEDEIKAEARAGYKQSKKATHVSASGKAATEVPNLDNESDRHAWMAEQVANRSQ